MANSKPNLNSYGPQSTSKSHAKSHLASNNYLNAVTKVPHTNTTKKSNFALKTAKATLPYQMTLNSPVPSTKIAKYTGMSGSPLRRIKSPVDWSYNQLSENTKLDGAAENSALSIKQSKTFKGVRDKLGQPGVATSFNRGSANQLS